METLGAPTASGCFILRSEPGLLSFSISQMRKLGLQWVGGPRGQQRSSGATANSSGLRRRPRRCRGSRCQGARGKRRVNIWGCSLGSGHFSSLRFGRVARAVPGRQGRRPHGCWDPPARPRPVPPPPAAIRRRGRRGDSRGKSGLRTEQRAARPERHWGTATGGAGAPQPRAGARHPGPARSPGLASTVPRLARSSAGAVLGQHLAGPSAARAAPSPPMKPPAAQGRPAAAAAAGEWGSP